MRVMGVAIITILADTAGDPVIRVWDAEALTWALHSVVMPTIWTWRLD